MDYQNEFNLFLSSTEGFAFFKAMFEYKNLITFHIIEGVRKPGRVLTEFTEMMIAFERWEEQYIMIPMYFELCSMDEVKKDIQSNPQNYKEFSDGMIRHITNLENFAEPGTAFYLLYHSNKGLIEKVKKMYTI